MKVGQRLRGRLRPPADGPADGGHRPPVPSAEQLAETLRSLRPKKQAAVLELWPAIELELEDGQKVTARSKKELRRFTKPRQPEMIEWFRGFDADEVFYDIGANCGALTLAAGVMHRGRITIVAVEPSFASFESLTRNLMLNGLMEFTIPLQVALLATSGLERMNYYSSTDAGTALHAVGRPVDHEGREFTPVEAQIMPAYALDDLIAVLKLPPPTRVKIDVDGHEGPLLHGAEETLSRGTVKEFAVEIVDHDRAGTRLESIQRLFDTHDYELTETFRHGGKASFVSDYLFRRRGWQGGARPAP